MVHFTKVHASENIFLSGPSKSTSKANVKLYKELFQRCVGILRKHETCTQCYDH